MQGLGMRSVKLMAQSRWKQTSGGWRRNEAHVVRPPKPINCATRPACVNQIQPLPLHPCAASTQSLNCFIFAPLPSFLRQFAAMSQAWHRSSDFHSMFVISLAQFS